MVVPIIIESDKLWDIIKDMLVDGTDYKLKKENNRNELKQTIFLPRKKKKRERKRLECEYVQILYAEKLLGIK